MLPNHPHGDIHILYILLSKIMVKNDAKGNLKMGSKT